MDVLHTIHYGTFSVILIPELDFFLFWLVRQFRSHSDAVAVLLFVEWLSICTRGRLTPAARISLQTKKKPRFFKPKIEKPKTIMSGVMIFPRHFKFNKKICPSLKSINFQIIGPDFIICWWWCYCTFWTMTYKNKVKGQKEIIFASVVFHRAGTTDYTVV